MSKFLSRSRVYLLRHFKDRSGKMSHHRPKCVPNQEHEHWEQEVSEPLSVRVTEISSVNHSFKCVPVFSCDLTEVKKLPSHACDTFTVTSK